MPAWSLRPATLADVPFLRDVLIEATRDQRRLPVDFDEPAWRAGFVPDGETETEYRLRRGSIA